MIELQIHRHPSLTEARTPCTLLFDGRRPAKLHHSLHGASSLGQAELNLSQLSPQIRAPRPLVRALCAPPFPRRTQRHRAWVRANALRSRSAPRTSSEAIASARAPAGPPQPAAMRPVTPQVTLSRARNSSPPCALSGPRATTPARGQGICPPHGSPSPMRWRTTRGRSPTTFTSILGSTRAPTAPRRFRDSFHLGWLSARRQAFPTPSTTRNCRPMCSPLRISTRSS